MTAGWWLWGLVALWVIPTALEALTKPWDWAHRPGWMEYAAVSVAILVTIPQHPVGLGLAWAFLVLYAAPMGWGRLKALLPHGGTVYLLRRRSGCYPTSRAGWVMYVGSTDDWDRRLDEHQDDRRDDWDGWKRDIDWGNSGPAHYTLTRRSAGRLENRTIRLLTYGVRIGALPPITNVAATRLRRGPHPFLWLRLKWAKWMVGTCVPGRRLYLTPTPADTGLSAAGPFPDAIEVDGWEAEDGETSPGTTGSADPPTAPAAPADAPRSPSASGPSTASSPDTSPPPDTCHPTIDVLPVPFHPTIPSHPSHPTSTPVGGGTEMPGQWDDGTADASWDETDPDDDPATGVLEDDEPEDDDGRGAVATKQRRKRTGGRRTSTARRGGTSGVPGWVPIARKVTRSGGSVTEAWQAVKDAGYTPSRSTVGRWVKDV